ncbi:hypothetical protein PspLS_01661 [Pyricularia sp. CBS 133598]|nr:hypothetical protein PspLS_01661 [Pyricularia sp. CBS 133598]
MDANEPHARMIWAAHILRLLTQGRSQPSLQQDVASTDELKMGGNVETDESDDDWDVVEDEDGALTDMAGQLSKSTKDNREKFLDCLAEILSPAPGALSVTATFMARAKIEAPWNVVNWKWIVKLRSLVADINGSRIWVPDESCTSCLPHPLGCTRGFRHAQHDFEQLVDLVQDPVKLQQNSFDRLVILAATALHCPTFRYKLSGSQKGRHGKDILRALRFLARIATNLQILIDIARSYPQLSNLKVCMVSASTLVAPLEQEFRVSLKEAWQRLELPKNPKGLGKRFKVLNDASSIKLCGQKLHVHAEVQL